MHVRSCNDHFFHCKYPTLNSDTNSCLFSSKTSSSSSSFNVKQNNSSDTFMCICRCTVVGSPGGPWGGPCGMHLWFNDSLCWGNDCAPPEVAPELRWTRHPSREAFPLLFFCKTKTEKCLRALVLWEIACSLN